jgi:hypothetical protein
MANAGAARGRAVVMVTQEIHYASMAQLVQSSLCRNQTMDNDSISGAFCPVGLDDKFPFTLTVSLSRSRIISVWTRERVVWITQQLQVHMALGSHWPALSGLSHKHQPPVEVRGWDTSMALC